MRDLRVKPNKSSVLCRNSMVVRSYGILPTTSLHAVTMQKTTSRRIRVFGPYVSNRKRKSSVHISIIGIQMANSCCYDYRSLTEQKEI